MAGGSERRGSFLAMSASQRDALKSASNKRNKAVIRHALGTADQMDNGANATYRIVKGFTLALDTVLRAAESAALRRHTSRTSWRLRLSFLAPWARWVRWRRFGCLRLKARASPRRWIRRRSAGPRSGRQSSGRSWGRTPLRPLGYSARSEGAPRALTLSTYAPDLAHLRMPACMDACPA